MRRRPRSRNTREAPGENWLEPEGAVDWRDQRQDEQSPLEDHHLAETLAAKEDPFLVRPAATRRTGRERPPAGGFASATIVRRRWLGVLAITGLVGAAVAGIIIGTSGGGSGKSPPAEPTAAPVKAPPAATKPATATPTAAGSATPTLTVAVPKSGQLGIGDRGTAVVTLQKALTRLKLDVGKPDGIFGSATQAAVIQFQKAHGLKPDGIVGPVTAAKLNAALAARG